MGKTNKLELGWRDFQSNALFAGFVYSFCSIPWLSTSSYTVILEIFVSDLFRIVRKFLEFMKIDSLLSTFPGLECTMKRFQLWKLVTYETPKQSVYEIY